MPFDPIYTFTSARDELVKRMGARKDLDLRAESWLDSAQLRMAFALIDVPDLYHTVASFGLSPDVAEYDGRTTLPPLTDVVGFVRVRNNTTGQRLRRFSFTDYRSLASQAKAEPTRWARWGYVVAFDPMPNVATTVKIDYRRRPKLGVLEMENQHMDNLIRLAEHIGWSALQEKSRAQQTLGELPAYVRSLIEQPLEQEQFEAAFDEDLAIVAA